jgi:hypothetical protein
LVLIAGNLSSGENGGNAGIVPMRGKLMTRGILKISRHARV